MGAAAPGKTRLIATMAAHIVVMTAATPQERAAAAVPKMWVHRASVATALSALCRGADNEQWCCCRDDVSDNAAERQC